MYIAFLRAASETSLPWAPVVFSVRTVPRFVPPPVVPGSHSNLSKVQEGLAVSFLELGSILRNLSV